MIDLPFLCISCVDQVSKKYVDILYIYDKSVIPAKAGIQKSRTHPTPFVIPAKAGIQTPRHHLPLWPLDPDLRRGDKRNTRNSTRERNPLPCAHASSPLCLHPRQPAQRHALCRRDVDLPQRIWQHKQGEAEGFTRRYGVKTLVWYEPHPTMKSAIIREKQIKEWQRSWKLRLIEEANPQWRDLHDDLNA